MACKLENIIKDLLDAVNKNLYLEAKRSCNYLIDYIVKQNLTEYQKNNVFAKIFDKDNGVQTIIKKVALNKNFRETKEKILEIYLELIKNYQNDMDTHLSSVLQVTNTLLKCCPTSKVQERCIYILTVIFEKKWKTTIDILHLYDVVFFKIRDHKISVTVKSAIFKFISVTIKNHSETFSKNVKKITELRDSLLFYLSEQTSLLSCKYLTPKYQVSVMLVESLIDCLNSLIDQFEDLFAEKESCLVNLYDKLKKWTEPKDFSKRGACRAVFRVIKNHASIFSKLLLNDCTIWNNLFTDWIKTYKNNHEDVKLGEYACASFFKCIADRVNENNSEENKRTFMKFYDNFKCIIENEQTTIVEFRIALRGFGYFSKACSVYLNDDKIENMLSLTLKKMNSTYLSSKEPSWEDLQHLPTYVTTLTDIIISLEEISDDELSHLEMYIILLIKSYPKMPSHHQVINISFMQCVRKILNYFDLFVIEKLLMRTIFESLIYTCSHSIVLECELNKETKSRSVVTYRNFLPFWCYILKNDQSNLIQKHLIAAIYEIIEKIDLTSNKIDDNDKIQCDPETCFKANCPKDVNIFVNLVDFFKDILNSMNSKQFCLNLDEFLRKMLDFSVKYPLISGFYKLLTCAFKISNRFCHFEENPNLNIMVNYLSNILAKFQLYNGDLHISMIELILNSPIACIEKLSESITKVLISAFNFGKNLLNIASLAIDSLKVWCKFLEKSKLLPILNEVLPILDKYLRYKPSELEENVDDKIGERKSSKIKHLIDEEQHLSKETDLISLQKKILLFLGGLNFDTENILLEVDRNDIYENAVHLTEKHQLKYVIPFKDMKINVYLDDILPRVLEIALHSSDRKTRIAASEMFHTIVIILLGIRKQQSYGSSKNLFEYITLPLLKLSCHVDETVKQLFQPLTIQIIHWQTSLHQLHSEESDVILDTILNTITHSNDCSLRDFSAICVKEFTVWSIKQDVNKSKTLVNINKILNKIVTYCLHPSSEKRLGAALAFNNLYKILREEQIIIDVWWLELFNCFVINLTLTEECNDRILSVNDLSINFDQVVWALDHILRVFIEKSWIFNRQNSLRRKPYGFENIFLKDCCTWLLDHCAKSLEIKTNRKCLDMFLKLSNQNNQIDFDRLIKRAEENLKLECDFVYCSLLAWLKRLLTLIDFYLWLKNHFEKFKLSEKVKVFQAIDYFIEHILCKDIDSNNSIEKLKFASLKLELIEKILQFLNCDIKYKIETKNLYLIIEYSIFKIIDKSIDYKYVINLINSIDNNEEICQIFEDQLKYFDINNIKNLDKYQILKLKAMLVINQTELPVDKIYFFNCNNLLEKISQLIVEERLNDLWGVEINSIAFEHYLELLKLTFSNCDLNSLLILLQNETLIKHPTTFKTLKRGDYFYLCFKDTILDFISNDKNIDKFINEVHKLKMLNILIDLFKQLRKKNRDKVAMVANKVLAKWDEFLTNYDQDLKSKKVLINLLQHILTIIKTGAVTEHNSLVDEWIVKQLCIDKNINESLILYKIKVLLFLQYLTHSNDDNNEVLLSTLKNFQQLHLTLTNDVFGNSLNTKKLNFTMSIKNIFKCFEQTASPTILKFLILVTSKQQSRAITDELNIETMLQTTIQREKIFNFMPQQLKLINLVYDTCLNIIPDLKLDADERIFVLLKFLIVIFNASKKSTIEKFFIDHLKELIDFLKIQIKDITDENFLKDILVKKMLCFALVEFLFVIEQTSYKNIQNFVFKNSNDEKIMAKTFTEFGFLAREKENLSIENDFLRELFRLYQCLAYKALVSIISNTLTDLNKYYPLFYRVDNGQELLWSKLIDLTKQYQFSIDFDKYPIKKTHLISIRKSIQSKELKEPDFSADYISSQNLFSSTLNEDITHFDFSYSYVRHQPLEEDNFKNKNEIQTVDLELDDLNEHECMPTVCALIKHIIEMDAYQNKGVISQISITAPNWIRAIEKNISTPSMSKNIKLYFLKVLANNQHLLKPYKHFFVKCVINSIVEKICGESVNYFIVELICMLLEWEVAEIDLETQNMLPQLIDFFINFINNAELTKPMIKYFLDLLKNIIELWKTYIHATDNLIKFVQIGLGKNVPEQQVTYIKNQLNIAAIFITNSIPLWTSNENKRAFFKLLLDYMKSTKRDILVPCSLLCGLILKMQEAYHNLDSVDLEFIDSFRKILLSLGQTHADFFTILDMLHKSYPKMVKKNLIEHLLELINNGTIKLTKQILVVMKLVTTQAKEIYNEISSQLCKQNFLKDLLNHSDSDLQFNTLILIKEIILFLPETIFNETLIKINEFILSKNEKFRTICYDIIIIAYLNKKEGSLIKTCLVRGLSDCDENVQNKLIEFWRESFKNERNETHEYFMKIMNELYSSNEEEYYLYNCIHFLLELSSESPDYDMKLFEYPLENCKFQELKLLINWRERHITMETPLFVETLTNQLSRYTTFEASNDLMIKATQDNLNFEPTVVGANNSSDLSSLLFTISHSSSDNFITKSFANSEDEDEVSRSEHRQIVSKYQKKVFLRDREKISKLCALSEVRKAMKRESLIRDLFKGRGQNVKIFRKYRVGDFPDIEIVNSSVIQLINALCKFDQQISRQIFISIYNGLVEQLKTKNLLDPFLISTGNHFSSILTETKNFTPHLIGMIFELVLNYEKTIRPSPDYITSASLQSKLLSLGCLVIEQQIINSNIEDLTNKPCLKKMCSSSEIKNDSYNWVKLAELYKNLSETDIVNDIFSKKIGFENINEAIKFESRNFWDDAVKIYKNSIETYHQNDFMKDYYYEAYFNALSQLANWQQVNQNVFQVCDLKLTNIWEDKWQKEKLLPYYFKSSLMSYLTDEPETKIVETSKIVKYWMEDEVISNDLSKNYTNEMLMFSLIWENYNLSKCYFELDQKSFLDDWSVINPFFKQIRSKKLEMLPILNDIDQFINVVDSINIDNYEEIIQTFVVDWSNLNYKRFKSIFQLETLISIRRLLIRTILDIFEKESKKPWDLKKIKEMKSSIFQMEFDLCEFSFNCNNIYFPKKYFVKNIKEDWDSINETKLEILQCKFVEAQLKTLKSEKEAFETLIKIWQKLGEINPPNKETKVLFLKQKSSLIDKFDKILKTDYQFNEQIRTVTGITSSSYIESVKAIINEFDKNKMDTHENQRYETNEELIDAYLKLIYYCRRADDINKYGELLINSILNAMKYGSKTAQQMFPCLLQLNFDRNLEILFLDQIKRVPDWMFILWIPQLLASLESKVFTIVSPIIERLTFKYPDALKYSFRLSKENYNSSQTDVQKFVSKLNNMLLGDENIEHLIRALNYVCVPEIVLSYYLNKLKKLLIVKEFEKAFDIYKEMHLNLFDETNVKTYLGKEYKSIEKYKNELSFDFLKEVGSNKNEIIKKLTNIRLKLKVSLETKKPSSLLKHYSTVLSDFHVNKNNLIVEIPGQYKGDREPLPKYHVNIVSFKSKIKVLPSLRKPIKLSIVGSDGNNYDFLVKFGEDLRLDHRIQQLFDLMNQILNDNLKCKSKQLSISTYQVIPLTKNLGMIEWIDNTVLLHDLMHKNIQNKVNQVHVAFEKWISEAMVKDSLKLNDYEKYMYSYKYYNRASTICEFRSNSNVIIPQDNFKKSFIELSLSLEDFFALRHNFAISYSVICLATWLLGIGDRHLQNNLINLKNGQVVSIDFDCSFGVATQNSPIPELMPFRLTPQILNLMNPLKEHGIIKQTMIHCLRALREHKETLMAAMEVFIQEPTISWLEYAENAQYEMRSNEKEDSTVLDDSSMSEDNSMFEGKSWCPKDKIKEARQKLSGANPVEITINLVRKNKFLREQYLKYYIDVIKGVGFRALKSQEILNVEDQVECLIEQAIDENILGRAYAGWEPWL